jgi:tetratricopeptide (TPR) repeat protein
LVTLGSLEAGLDYARAGDSFARALDLARALGDPRLTARSLNRVGNWQLNAAGPQGALPFHHEALAHFEAERDRRGLAETLDLLGMTYNILGDPRRSSRHYARAIAAFRAMDERQGLVNSLVIRLLQSGSYWHDTLAPAELNEEDARRAADEALGLAREIGWPAGECYVLYELALWLGPRGEYAPALEHARSALAIASAIEHRQWIAGCHATLGALLLDLLALPAAREHLERALDPARVLGSRLWAEIASAVMGSVCILQRDLSTAAAVLDAAGEADDSLRTIWARMVWCARAPSWDWPAGTPRGRWGSWIG